MTNPVLNGRRNTTEIYKAAIRYKTAPVFPFNLCMDQRERRLEVISTLWVFLARNLIPGVFIRQCIEEKAGVNVS
jgi:hypothetical protein